MGTIASWVAAVAIAVGAGCVMQDGTDDGVRIEVDSTELRSDLAYVALSPKPSLMGLGGAQPAGELPEDPCDCGTPACLHDWLELNVGCDVCLTFVCAGEPSAHVCVACPDAAGSAGDGSDAPPIQ